MSEAGASESQPFRARTALALALVGVFAFGGLLVMAAFGGDIARAPDPGCRATSTAHCAVGFAGLRELVRESGAPAVVLAGRPPRGRADGLLVVTPQPGRATDIAGLGYAGPVLVVLPKWATIQDPKRPRFAFKLGPIPMAAMPQTDILDDLKVARRPGIARPVLTGAPGEPLAGLALRPGAIDRLQTFLAPDWVPVLRDEAGRAVIAHMPTARIYVLSEPDLLNTHGLADPATFAAAVSIVRALRVGDGPVLFEAAPDGAAGRVGGGRNALKLALAPPFLAVTLCLIAALTLAVGEALVRFGPIRAEGRAIALGKEALVDNTAQLVRLARREPRMAAPYAAFTRGEAARAVGAPGALGGEALTLYLDRLAERRGLADRLGALVVEAETVKTRAGLVALARRLYQWRSEMTRESL